LEDFNSFLAAVLETHCKLEKFSCKIISLLLFYETKEINQVRMTYASSQIKILLFHETKTHGSPSHHTRLPLMRIQLPQTNHIPYFQPFSINLDARNRKNCCPLERFIAGIAVIEKYLQGNSLSGNKKPSHPTRELILKKFKLTVNVMQIEFGLRYL